MIEKINELRELLVGKRIKHKSRIGYKFYNVKSVVERSGRIVIETNELKTFTNTLDSIDDFIEAIEVISEIESLKFDEIKNNFIEPEKTKLPMKQLAFVAPETTKNVSDGLMSVFNDLTADNHITEEKLKQAKLACDVAGKIIDIEKIRLGYLALNYR